MEMPMLPDKPKLSDNEQKIVRDFFDGQKYSNSTEWLIRELIFGSDEFFNVLTPFKFSTQDGNSDYLRSAFDIKKGMELEKSDKRYIVEQELTSSEKFVIETLSSYYKNIREAIREESFSDTPFFYISKRDLNLINKRAKELVQEVIDEVING